MMERFTLARVEVPSLRSEREAETAVPSEKTVERPSRRIESIDLIRGLLMILMALDHTRDFFSNASVNPTDAVNSWPALFATRWVTHLCAPGFVALAGTSVYLQGRYKSRAQVVHLLWTRGLWFILLELTVVAFGWSFSLEHPLLQVIWAIGGSMLVLAALYRLPVAVIGGIGLAITMLHNKLDGIDAARFGRGQDLWELVHQAGPLHLPKPMGGFMAYPVLPWAGIMLLGYWYGVVVMLPGARRRRISLAMGAAFLCVYTLLRLSGAYGDANHFEHLATPAHTAMSFLVVAKYPPSLQYSLITLGVLLIGFAIADGLVDRQLLPGVRGFFDVYGQVPFFYYLLHLYLIHVSALIAMMAVSHNWSLWRSDARDLPGGVPGFGYSLPVIYLIWAAVVLALYLPCRYYGRLKSTRRDWWLSYI